MPYVNECYRMVVGIKPQTAPKTLVAKGTQDGTGSDSPGYVGDTTEPVERSNAAELADTLEPFETRPRSSGAPQEPPRGDDDSGMLLIDFR